MESKTSFDIERLIQYRALPSQRRFLNLAERFKGFSGPVGAGKSTALCYEALRLAHRNPGCVGLIGAPTYGVLRDVTLRAFLEHCESLGIEYQLNRSEFTLLLRDAGSQVLFRSMDSAERLRGSNLAWFGVDELSYCKEEAWVRLEARLRDPAASRMAGFGVWTPKGFDWVYRRFCGERVEGYGLVEAQPFENRFILERTPDYYERLKASYDDGFYEQEVLGKYRNVRSGQVYYAFDRARNIGSRPLDESRPLLWALDFNVNPMASVVAQREGETVWVLDEIVLPTASTVEVCEEYERRYGNHRAGVRVFGDASGRNRRTSSRHSDVDQIEEFLARRPELRGEVRFGTANPAVRERVNLTNGKLRNAEGRVGLFVGEPCRRLIEDLEQVSYKPDSMVVDKSDPRRTHLSDALGYLLWGEFHSPGRVGERDRRLF